MRLQLTLQESTQTIKIVNVTQQREKGSTIVTLKVGALEDQCKVRIVPLDDFDLILGIKFLAMWQLCHICTN